jgi:hypothetical protein
MKVAFISGPYRAPTPYEINQNIRRAEAVAIKYWQAGYAVICPHKNTALFDGLCDDKIWLAGDMEFLKRSDVIVMCENWSKSKGSLQEHSFAVEYGIQIIYEDPI